jgi:dipeptidyl aminopeptidase/acylaminoacyl peptidase
MPRRVTSALSVLAFLSAWAALGLAQDDPEKVQPAQPAVLDLLLPAGATVSVDDKDLGDTRSVTIDDVKPTEYRRVKVAVKYPDGSQDERLVDVAAGQRVAVPMPLPGPDKLTAVAAQMLTPVQAAALSRDGRHIAVGMETVVVLWDTAAGRPVRTLAGHQKMVLSVAFSPDGKQVLTGSADAAAVLWDTNTGRQIRTFKGHKGAITSVAFSPDGKQVLTGSADRTAILWKAESGEPIHTLQGHTREIMAVAYSPDGAALATASADRSAALWEAATGKQTFVLRGHREEVACIAFSPDGRQAATGSYDDSAILWDATTGKRVRTAARHGNDIYSITFTPDGRRVVTGEREELVMAWDLATGQKVRTFPGHTAAIVSTAVSPDGRRLLTGSRDGTARLWDLATGQEVLTLTTDPTRKSWAAAAPDGLFDATGTGRQLLGFRFTKTSAGNVDQFFDEYYRPGLLAEVFQGRWPMAQKPLGRSKPPRLKIVSPKARVAPLPEMAFTVDVSDQGGGASPLIVENNGVRIDTPTRSEPAPDPQSTRTSFTLPLAPGPNKVRIKAASADGSWEAVTTDFELTYPRAPEHNTRMYVVAVGVSSYAEKRLNLGYPAKDAQAVAELLRRRNGKIHDRVDVIPLFDGEATKAIIEDTVRDVAELTRPQDTLVVLLCGHGAMLGGRLYFAPHDLRVGEDRPEDALRARGLAVDDLAGAMAAARALKRVLIVDTAASGVAFGGALQGRSEFGLRGALERLSRSKGIHTLAAVAVTDKAVECEQLGHGVICSALTAAAKGLEGGPLDAKPMESAGPAGAIDVADWFLAAAEQAGTLMEKYAGAPPDVYSGTPSRGFALLMPDKERPPFHGPRGSSFPRLFRNCGVVTIDSTRLPNA